METHKSTERSIKSNIAFLNCTSMPDLHKIVLDFLNRQEISRSAQLICAVSGGLDSTVLAHILLDIGYPTLIANCDFQLRVASGIESEFVRDVFSKRGTEVYHKKFNTQSYADEEKISIQVAARKLRYEWLDVLIAERNATACLTAHHGDDQVETLLLHWIKGNSPVLMKGIPSKRGKYLRPLLSVSRKDILAFATDNTIRWMEDESNQNNKYQRNQIRNLILPVIEGINPAFAENLLEHYVRYSRQQNVLNKLLTDKLSDTLIQTENSIVFHFEKALEIAGENASLVFLEFWLGEQGWEGKLIPAVLGLIRSQTGKIIRGKNFVVEKNRSTLVFYLEDATAHSTEFVSLTEQSAQDIHLQMEEEVLHIHKTKWQGQSFQKECLVLDAEKIVFPVVVRHWKPGDKMIPLGMKNEKKLSDIFTDEKISLHKKNKTWVIEDQNQIIALTGFRIADPFRVDLSTTKEVYEIRLL